MADKSTKKKKSDGTFKQLVQVYRFTARNDKALPWWMALVFVAPIIVLIVVCLVTKANVLVWILLMLTAVLVFSQGKLAPEVKKALAKTMAFDAENSRGLLQRKAKRIIENVK